MSKNHIYLKEERNGVYHSYKIKNKILNERFGFDIIKYLGPFKEKSWYMIKFSIVKTHIRLMTSMLLYNSSFFVTHSTFLSIYNLREEKWTQNLKFNDVILKIIKGDSLDFNSIYVIFENTQSRRIVSVSTDVNDKDANNETFNTEPETNLPGFKGEGKLVSILSDSLYTSCFLYENSDKKREFYSFSYG